MTAGSKIPCKHTQHAHRNVRTLTHACMHAHGLQKKNISGSGRDEDRGKRVEKKERYNVVPIQ